MFEKSKKSFLRIEKGLPYRFHESFLIAQDRYLIGRASENHQPDLAFSSPYISRRHAEISFQNGGYLLTDFSKHGTSINGVVLTPNVPCSLKHGDLIGLARNEALLTFFLETSPDETMTWPDKKEPVIILNEATREVFIDGNQIELNGNLYTLFHLLYQNRGKVVSNLLIKETVWPERNREKGYLLVGDEEVIVLVKRLRDKLGEQAGLICNKRGYGYFLK